MVVNKKNIYDEQLDPLLVVTGVEAVPADEAAAQVDVLRRQEEQEQPRMDPPEFQTVVEVPKMNANAEDDESATDGVVVVDPVELEQQQKVGAGVASGLFGLLLGGPLLAMVFGFGAAYATQKPGGTGDTARAVGDLALSAKERALEIDRKHQVVNKSQVVANDAWNKAQKLDQKHHLLSRARDMVLTGFQNLATFVHQHRLIDRGVETVGKGTFVVVETIAERISGNKNDMQQNQNLS